MRCATGHRAQIRARGLCASCYARHRRAGTLDAFPLAGVPGRPAMHGVGRPRQVLEDTEWLRTNGMSRATLRQLAERLGLSHSAYRKALWRARAASSAAA